MLTAKAKLPSRSESTTSRKTAKLFRNGRSQAVRLPAEFAFEGSEVSIRRDLTTGEVILSPKPGPQLDSWQSRFAAWDSLASVSDKDELKREQQLPIERDFF